MAKKTRKYFFNAPSTVSHDRFVRKNIPSELTYRHFLDSVCFVLEKGDTASEASQGLLKLATNANVKTRTSPGAAEFKVAVRPHQLPLMVGGNNVEAHTIDTPVTYGGLKLTPVDDAGNVRMNLKIEFDPTNLDVAVLDAANDKLILIDVNDGNKPKKFDASEIVASTGFWKRTGTVLEPKTTNDSIDLGTGAIKGGNITLEGASNRTVKVDPNVAGIGSNLGIEGAGGSTDGGELRLAGGDGSAGNGGDVHLHGGQGSVDDGNVLLAYTQAHVAQGLVGVGGLSESGYILKTHGDIKIMGNIYLNAPSSTAPDQFLGWNSGTKLIIKRSVKNAMNDIVGTPTKGDVIYFNGTDWTRLSNPGADRWFAFDIATDLPKWDTAPVDSNKVKVKAAGAEDYLGNLRSNGVIRIPTEGGIGYIDNSSYIDLILDVDDLQKYDLSSFYRDAYLPMVDENGNTKKLYLSSLYGTKSGSGWIALIPGTDYTTQPTTTRTVLTTDLTGYFTEGQPVKFKLDGVADYRYAVISEITATYIEIAGDPMTTGAGDLTEMYIGDKSKITTKEFFVGTNYNSVDSTGVLEGKNNAKEGAKWAGSSAKLIGFGVIHNTGDGTVQPNINMRVGLPSATTKYISTSNTNEGLTAGTSWNVTEVDIDPSQNDINFGDNIEVKVMKKGTGDADDLTVTAMFVMK